MGQRTKELYSELIGILAEGKKAALVSVYKPGETVSKYITTGIETLSLPADAVTDGPVTHFMSEDQSLTVVETYLPRPRLIILGGGHIALALSGMAKACDFHVIVFDDRPRFADQARFPSADEVILDDFSNLADRLHIGSADYVAIVTRGHKHDKECLEAILGGEAPIYTGMIGSKRRVALVMNMLAEAGYPNERLDEIYSPIGLHIGAVTPAEISVSILAEIIEVKRKKKSEKGGLSCDIETASLLAEKGDSSDALITILETKGPVPRETGAKMSMSYEGSLIGTIGGGCAESDVIGEARAVIRGGGWKTLEVDMTDTAEEDGMVCGGYMTVLIERS